jgi:hypothetical protein
MSDREIYKAIHNNYREYLKGNKDIFPLLRIKTSILNAMKELRDSSSMTDVTDDVVQACYAMIWAIKSIYEEEEHDLLVRRRNLKRQLAITEAAILKCYIDE